MRKGGSGIINLDKNEGLPLDMVDDLNISFRDINRYPDNDCKELRASFARLEGVAEDFILVGNGSSELLSVIIRNSKGTVLGFSPSFWLYEHYAKEAGNIYYGVGAEGFGRRVEGIVEEYKRANYSLIVIANPENPTGHVLKKDSIRMILDNVKAKVLIDEAYMDYSGESVLELCMEYDNLIVTKSLSKGFSMAGLRVGYVVSNPKNIIEIKSHMPMYSVGALSQRMALRAIAQNDEIVRLRQEVIKRRESTKAKLKDLGLNVYPSGGNFIFFKGGTGLGDYLKGKGILVRSYQDDLLGYYRVTIGTILEMKSFIDGVKEFLNEDS